MVNIHCVVCVFFLSFRHSTWFDAWQSQRPMNGAAIAHIRCTFTKICNETHTHTQILCFFKQAYYVNLTRQLSHSPLRLDRQKPFNQTQLSSCEPHSGDESCSGIRYHHLSNGTILPNGEKNCRNATKFQPNWFINSKMTRVNSLGIEIQPTLLLICSSFPHIETMRKWWVNLGCWFVCYSSLGAVTNCYECFVLFGRRKSSLIYISDKYRYTNSCALNVYQVDYWALRLSQLNSLISVACFPM